LVMVQKILIIHSGGIGDLLLALPAMRLFRRAFSSSILELMGRPERLSLVGFDLHAESIHSIDQAGMAYFYSDAQTLPPRLSTFFSSFRVALVFGRTNGNILAENLKRAGVDRVITIPPFPETVSGIHVSDFLVESLRASGIEGENSFIPLRLSEDRVSFARDFLADVGLKEGDPLLAIHSGSGSPAKNWDSKNFARVADWVSDRAQVLLISGPADGGIEEVRRAMKKAKPIFVENLPLIQLAAVLNWATAYVGNDSGITHLAASLGMPTVAIFGPTDPTIWGPQGPRVRIFYQKNSCSPCSSETQSACSRPCLGSIDPDSVIELLSPIFEVSLQPSAGGFQQRRK